MPVPWLLEVCWPSLAILGFCFIPPTSALHGNVVFSLCVCPNFRFFIKTPGILNWGPLKCLTFTWLCLQRPHFQIRSHFNALGIFSPQQLIMMKWWDELLSQEGWLMNQVHGVSTQQLARRLPASTSVRGRIFYCPRASWKLRWMNGVYCGHKRCSQICHFSSWAMIGICFPSLELGRSLQEQRAICHVSFPNGSDGGSIH